MKTKINKNLLRSMMAILASTTVLLAALFVASPQPAEAAVNGCGTSSDAFGRAEHVESGVAAGNYTVFARVKAPQDGTATFKLSIDGAGGQLCDFQVRKTGATNWIWFESGATTLNWTSSSDMRFQMSGDKSGVGLDCVVLFDRSQGSFNPTTSKDDCSPSSSASDASASASATAGGGSLCDASDVDSSGSVNILDVRRVYDNRGSGGGQYDVDNSGSVNILDVRKVYDNRGCN